MLEELIGMNDNKPMGDRVYIYDSLMPSKVDMSVQKQVCNMVRPAQKTFEHHAADKLKCYLQI